MGSDCLPMARGSRLGQIARVNLRTTYGQLRGEKYRSLVPKRHQIKHLGFLLRWFGTRRPVVSSRSAARSAAAAPRSAAAPSQAGPSQ
jgi:hypothetical protein